jgi:Na+/H+ antiporter NhaD/arsenite permease-like protein
LERNRGPSTYVPGSAATSRGGVDPTNVVADIVFAAVFGALIVRQVTLRGPGAWALLGVGAIGTWALGVLPGSEVVATLAADAPTLLFLLALFVLAQALESSGALDHLARWLVGRARRPADLPFVLFVGLGLTAAFLVNDALVVIGVPLLVAVAARLGVPSKPLLLVLALSVTVGSTLTPFGNPQNLLVAEASGLSSPVTVFLRYLALPTAINLVLGGLYVRWAFGRTLRGSPTGPERATADVVPLVPRSGWGQRLRNAPVLAIFPVTMLLLIGLDFAGSVTRIPAVPAWEIAMGGAVATLLATPARRSVVGRVDWTILILFAGLFVVVAGAAAGGVVGGLESVLPIPGPGHAATSILAVVGTSALGAQLVSNVPWVALQLPVLSGIGYSASSPVVWVALAAGSTLAGNITLIGAASNLLLVEGARRHGIRIRLGEFVRAALPLFGITITVLLVCLIVGI